MRSEADVRGALTRALRANNAQAQPIESGSTGLGIPDLFVRTVEVSAWIELKFERYEPGIPYTVPYRPGQFGWLTQHYKLGGTAILGIWTPSGLHCFMNEFIREVYQEDLKHCNFGMASISGRAFLDWLDNNH